MGNGMRRCRYHDGQAEECREQTTDRAAQIGSRPLGFGVGAFSAAMPAVILTVTPIGETSSAMAFNQVVRSVGFSLGSLVLAAHTPANQLFPVDNGYTTAAWLGVAAIEVPVVASPELSPPAQCCGWPASGRVPTRAAATPTLHDLVDILKLRPEPH